MSCLKSTLEDVSPENLINYDESAMSDDPGKKKMIFQKGIKNAEKNLNVTKSNISVMFSVSASGALLPPYIIYKAKNLYAGWTENGPIGARYASTSHGWIDGVSFSDWFQSIILPYRKKHPGKFAMIGDNLSSHFTEEVIRLALENDIQFVFLPPNSTHITQPLDVAVFSSLKTQWKGVLKEWKAKNSRQLSMEKTQFPNLLKTCIDKNENIQSNIISGFRTTGIYPLNPDELLKKFQNKEDFNPELVSESFIELLSQSRSSTTPRVKRGRKINVEPGN